MGGYFVEGLRGVDYAGDSGFKGGSVNFLPFPPHSVTDVIGAFHLSFAFRSNTFIAPFFPIGGAGGRRAADTLVNRDRRICFIYVLSQRVDVN